MAMAIFQLLDRLERQRSVVRDSIRDYVSKLDRYSYIHDRHEWNVKTDHARNPELSSLVQIVNKVAEELKQTVNEYKRNFLTFSNSRDSHLSHIGLSNEKVKIGQAGETIDDAFSALESGLYVLTATKFWEGQTVNHVYESQSMSAFEESLRRTKSYILKIKEAPYNKFFERTGIIYELDRCVKKASDLFNSLRSSEMMAYKEKRDSKHLHSFIDEHIQRVAKGHRYSDDIHIKVAQLDPSAYEITVTKFAGASPWVLRESEEIIQSAIYGLKGVILWSEYKEVGGIGLNAREVDKRMFKVSIPTGG